MGILIAYASKTGTTADCAKKLKDKLQGAVTADLSKTTPDPDDYEKIVVGASVRMGKLNKKAVNFMKKNSDKLKDKTTAVFMCCCNSDEMEGYIKRSLPDEIADKLAFYDSFGGEMDVDRQKGVDKFIVKSILKNPEASKDLKTGIREEAMERFAHRLAEA